MKISLNWLKEYVDLNGISLDDIVDKITVGGLEVEEVIDQAGTFENIVVGYVAEHGKHPNADKLSLCKVSDGKETFSVVCGAPNVAAGQKVAFAKVGAVIPSEGFKLTKAKIRGEHSFGMLCSERELGLSDNHEGIMVLDSALHEGTPFADAMGMNDVILDIAITPNRADALSHYGIARDLAAIFNRELKLPEIVMQESGSSSSELAAVEIEDAVNCPRYVGKVVTGVEIKESPEWLKKRIKSIGMRPINNVVDVTNFVMHEIGQPLHAFDLDNLSGKKIVVRGAGKDEKFVTLDSKERKLAVTDLMICDASKPVAVAGVMGGENSEVTSSSKNILIESAFFNPSSVRKTAKMLGLSTDASYRFERGTDPGITVWAARRAAQLIQQTAGGTVAPGEIDAYPNKLEKRIVELRFARIKKILGYEIENGTARNILSKLGFGIVKETPETLTVEIPLGRHDVEREIDLIEEVARIYGYDKIPEISKISVTLEEKVDQSEFNDNLRNLLCSLGFYEIITNSLLNEDTANSFGSAIGVLNPQSSEMSHLRTSLLPGLLTSISNNVKVKESDLQLYEIGKVFNRNHEREIKSFEDFTESEHLMLAVSGKAVNKEWFGKDREFDFYDLKGFAGNFLSKLFKGSKVKGAAGEQDAALDFTYSLTVDGSIVGSGGRVNAGILKNYDIPNAVYIFLFDIGKLKAVRTGDKRFSELLKFPKVYRDFAFVFDTGADFQGISEVIFGASSKLLHNIKLFDIFQSDSLGKGKKSLAFQLEYFDASRTLTEEEVEKDFRNAIKAVTEKFNAQLRGA